MEKKKLKIWDHIDNTLSEQEEAAFQVELSNDQVLNQQFEDAKKVDSALRQIEPEEPSMRFNMNVFEQLPTLYKKVQVSPLLSRRAFQIGILSVAILVFISLAPVFFVGGEFDHPYLNFWEQLLQMKTEIPSEWILMLAVASFGFVAYAIIDRQIKRRILRRNIGSKT